MMTLQPIDSLPLHEMKMTVPPLLPTGITAEPPLFSSGDLLHLLAAAFTSGVMLYGHSHLLPRYRRSAAKRLHGVFGQSDDLRDFLVSLALPTKIFYLLLLLFCHGVLPSLQLKGQKPRFSADVFIKSPLQESHGKGETSWGLLKKKISPAGFPTGHCSFIRASAFPVSPSWLPAASSVREAPFSLRVLRWRCPRSTSRRRSQPSAGRSRYR